jgi:predicted kinase
LDLERIAAELGLPFHGLWLTAEPSRLIERVNARRDDASDAIDSVVRQQLKLDIGVLSPRWSVLDANGSTAKILERALPVLAGSTGPWVQVPTGAR